MATLVWAVPQPFSDELVTRRCSPCDRLDVPAIDRFALDRRSSLAKTSSDVSIGVVLTLPLLLDALDVHDSGSGWIGFGEDAVVMAQAVVLSGALNQVVKLAVQRPRPLLYGTTSAADRADPDNYLSFYSSHTSTAFSAGLSYASTFALRHPGSPYRYVVYGGAIAAGSGVGLLRMLAGKHFPSDVIVGAVAGSAIGLGVPWLHRRESRVAIYPHGAGVMLVGTF